MIHYRRFQLCSGRISCRVCVAADLKKPLTEDTVRLNHCVVKTMLSVVHAVLHLMKFPPLLHQNRACLLYQLVQFLDVTVSDADDCRQD